jgi:4-amino-4-deoxy-L-arabinose transferase-like glycosyltransferase
VALRSRLPALDAGVETIVVLVALLGIAGAARWPNLWLIPTFTDETIEVKLAYDIARGEAAPLTNVDPYIGALWNWALAVGFWTFGLNPWLPRLLAFFGGVATVGAAWWLGREMAGRAGGRLAGIVAGLFMAGCSTHVLVNSHVAWSHATTPLWSTLGFACLLRAIRKDLTPQPPHPRTVGPLRGANIGCADVIRYAVSPRRRGEGESGRQSGLVVADDSGPA